VTSQRRGQALVEFALIVPLIFLLAVNAVNFGGFFYAWITVADAARAGAQYIVTTGPAPATGTTLTPTSPTQIALNKLVQTELSSLLNRSSLVLPIPVCITGTLITSCSSFSDPEGSDLATVDVTYKYVPFIQLFDFPLLGIHATLTPTKIHRQAVMRMLQ
jgi:hypothetical protein